MLAAMLTIETTRHDVARTRAEQPVGDDVQHAALHRGELVDRQHVEEQHVEQDVDRHHRQRADRQRPRHVPPGIADLFGDIRGGVPARVGEHHRNQRQQPRAARHRSGRSHQVLARSGTEGEPQRDEDEQRRDLQAGQRVGDEAAWPDAADMDPRHQRDRAERHCRAARERERDERQRDDEQRRRVVGGRHESADVCGEHHRAGRDCAGESGDERRPAGQERGQPAERRLQVDVLAAGARPHRGELRVGHRARKRQRTAHHPCGQEPPRAGHARRDLRRREEDAAADDVGDDDRRGVERTEAARERAARAGAVRGSATGGGATGNGQPIGSATCGECRSGRARPSSTSCASQRR